MFGRLRSIRVKPVLAGGFSEHHDDFSKTDSIGRRQPLDEAPKELVYKNYAITDSAPEYDFIAQVLGDSMNRKSLLDKDLVLCKHVKNSYDIRKGKIVIMPLDDENIENSWRCFRNVESVEDNMMIVSSVRDGKVHLEKRNVGDVKAIALYRIPAPKQHPVVG